MFSKNPTLIIFIQRVASCYNLLMIYFLFPRTKVKGFLLRDTYVLKNTILQREYSTDYDLPTPLT